jgi:hypothetical protein
MATNKCPCGPGETIIGIVIKGEGEFTYICEICMKKSEEN